MNAAEIKDMTEARAALARQRNAMARKVAAIELAPVSMAEDLTCVLLAIEAVDRALADTGQPFIAVED